MGDISRIEEAYSWNITRLAEAFGLHRGTVRQRLNSAGVVPSGVRNGASVYALRDVGPALFSEHFISGSNPDDMTPTDRKAWYQSEKERIGIEREMRLLIPVEEVHREMSRLAKTVANGLDGLADMLERDAGLSPEAVERVERVTDLMREQLYQAVIEEDADE